MEKLLSVGKILNFHGVQGEVKVGYTLGKEDQLTSIKQFYAIKNDKTIPLTVESIRFHKKIALIKFKEVSSIDGAIELKGAYLKAPKSQLEKYLEEDEFYIDDLIDMDVYDTENNYIGKIKFVASLNEEDILTIEDQQNHRYMIPFVKDLVPEVDIKHNKIVIKKIPGLLEEITEQA